MRPDTPEPGGGKVTSRLLILAAVVLWSSSGWFVRNPLFHSWPQENLGLVLAFWRALFAGLLILPFARRPRWRPGLVPLVMSFALMNGTYLSAMTKTTAANAIWLQYTAPMWVFLFGLAVGERVRRDDLILLVFGMLGVGTILGFELQGEQLSGVGLGLLAGMFYAGVVLSMRRLSGENPAWLISLSLLLTSAVMAPFVVRLGTWPSGGQFAMLACFGLFQMGLPYVLFVRGLRGVSSLEASGIGLLEPILLPLWILGDEVPKWWTLVGGALILVGLAVRYGLALKRR